MTLKNLLGISLDTVNPDKAQGDLTWEAAATQCLASAQDLLAHVRAWLIANRPGLV